MKEVLPDASVIVHIGGAHNVADWDCWFFKEFQEAGGKFDMIGLSHYPDYNKWNSYEEGAVSNINAARNIAAVGERFGVPEMIVETGFSNYDAEKASTVMKDLFSKTRNLPQCVGIFYWEPEVDGQWKPAYYELWDGALLAWEHSPPAEGPQQHSMLSRMIPAVLSQ